LDGDFQSNYLAAEQAYGSGDFETACRITLGLLSQLEPVPEDGPEQDAVLAWRAFVALLAGHIYLYGFQDPVQAQHFYELVLASKPQDTLRELAEQGLERTRSDQESLTRSERMADPVQGPSTEPLPTTESLTLIADPFLSAACTPANPGQPTVVTTAMPWLSNGPSIEDPERSPSNPDDGVTQPQAQTEPQPEPLSQSISDPLRETTSAITELDSGPSDEDPERSPSNPDDGVTQPQAQPEAGDELVQGSAAESSTTETQTSSDPEVSDEIRTRLEAGSLVVRLQDMVLYPTETSSEGPQAKDRWAWLRTALRRS